MLGYVSTPDPNRYVADKWVGKRVNRNGTDENGTVLRAFWQGAGQPVKLSVDWDVQSLATGALTDSEHVTLVKSSGTTNSQPESSQHVPVIKEV